jgi:hypothetical protein
MPEYHPSWAGHDPDRGMRDALALITATDALDPDMRYLIANDSCTGCVIEALLTMVLSFIDSHWDGDVKDYAHTVTKGMSL